MPFITILLITNLFPTKYTPNKGRFIEERYRNLSTLGINVVVLCIISGDIDVSVSRISKNFTIYTISVGNFQDKSILAKFQSISKGSILILKTIVSLGDVDIIIVEYPNFFINIISILTKIYLNSPLILSFRGTDLRNLPNKSLIQYISLEITFFFTTKIFILNKEMLQHLSKFNIKPSVSIVKPGIDPVEFQLITSMPIIFRKNYHDIQNLRNSVDLMLLMVGKFDGHKMQDILIYNIEKLNKELDLTVGLVLIGSIKKLNIESDLIRRIENNTNIIHLEYIPHDYISKFFESCDIYIHLSLNEGTPTVIMEAMSLGKIILASNVGGIPDLLQNGRGIILNNTNIASELRTNLRNIFENKSKYENLGEKAKNYIYEYRTSLKEANQIKSILLKLLFKK